ncbi:hypothetical protein GCM10010121_097490 [Streptomyces brasiliensis]|uniref:Uncharacterized protein n=1 Tax=Streptomyces brasiliensis TaxID=1954 RepID=A0A917UNR2_9ACTN|nr:hypothetical protein GCM10010121_097490 [Streptomyces brasiliensis]
MDIGADFPAGIRSRRNQHRVAKAARIMINLTNNRDTATCEPTSRPELTGTHPSDTDPDAE